MTFDAKRLYRAWKKNPQIRAAFEARAATMRKHRDRHAQPLGHGGKDVGPSVDVEKWLSYAKADDSLETNDDICDQLQRWEHGRDGPPKGWEDEPEPKQ